MRINRFLSVCLMSLGMGLLCQAAKGETRIISVNFSEGSPVSTGTYANHLIGYGDSAVPGSQWIDCTSAGKWSQTPTERVNLAFKDNTGNTGLYTNLEFFVCSRGGFYQAGRVSDGNTQMLYKFLDDNPNHKIRAGFKLTHLPFSRYKVLVYFNRDGSGPVPAYQVNGSYYKGGGVSVGAAAGDTWGSPNGATSLSPERNTLIVDGLTDPTLLVNASTEAGGRGCISGFQIVGTIGDSIYPLQATVSQDSAWEDLTWTDARGEPYTGGWTGEIPGARLIAAGGTVTAFPPALAVSKLQISGEGAFTFAPEGEGAFVPETLDFSAHTGRGILGGGFTPRNVIAGRDTVLTTAGSGKLTVYANMRATCKGFVWDASRTLNAGIIALSGGTAESPISLSVEGGNTRVGPYLVCSNSFFKCTSVGGNKLYLIDGEGADTSTLIMDSDRDWGMTAGTAIRRVKAIVGPSPEASGTLAFWFQSGEAMDNSVVLDLQVAEMVVTTDITIGGLTGNAELMPSLWEPAMRTVTVGMVSGPTSYSGKIRENLALAGASAFTYTGSQIAGTLSIAEGASLICETSANNVFSGSAISGNGSLVKSGGLLLPADCSGFSGSITVDGDVLRVVGPSGNPGVTASRGTALQLGGMTATSPLIRLQAVTGDTVAKIPLKVLFTDADQLKTGWLKILEFPEGMTAENFEVEVVSDFTTGQNVDASLYEIGSQGNLLRIRASTKVWSGTEGGNGTWSTSAADLVWNDKSASFENDNKVSFGDIPEANPTVTVSGRVQPKGIGFDNAESRYHFIPGNEALIALNGPLVFGQGEVILGVPVQTSSGIDINSGMRVTLGLFGPELEAASAGAAYTQTLNLRPGGTLILAPGEGKTQRVKEFSSTTADSVLVISNGIVAAAEGGTYGSSGFFRDISPVVEAGGVLLFDRQDISGYDTANHPITLNPGGELRVTVRDTLRRGLVLKGGRVTVSGAQSGRALDLFGDNTSIQVHSDSEIVGEVTEAEPDPKIALRGNPVVVNVAPGANLLNSVTYVASAEARSLKKVGDGNLVQNGVKMAGSDETYPLTYEGETLVASGTYTLNCEHRNGASVYTVKSGARLTGTGSVTGSGQVRIEGPNSKLCGGLSIQNLGLGDGSQIGDPWTEVSATVRGSLALLGETASVTLQNGSFTLCKGCESAGAAKLALSVAKDGVLALEAGATLNLDAAPTFSGENTGIRIGIDFTGGEPVFPKLQIRGAANVENVTFSAIIEGGTFRTTRIPLLTATEITGYEGLSTAGLPAERKWKLLVETGTDGTRTLYAEAKNEMILILK